MAQHRRKFSPAFKAEAIQFVLQTGRPVTQIAQELDFNKGTLHNWVNTWKLNNPKPSKALSPVESAAVAEMETEIRRLRTENEFLKKAAANSTVRCDKNYQLIACGGKHIRQLDGMRACG